MTYADNLRAALKGKGWRANDLARAISEKALPSAPDQPNRKGLISTYVHGPKEPSPEIEALIDKAFGFSVRNANRPTAGQRRWDRDHPQKTPDSVGLVYFEWTGHLSPAVASKVSALIAGDIYERVFHWHMSETPTTAQKNGSEAAQ